MSDAPHARKTPAPPPGRLVDSPAFPQAAAQLLENKQLRENLGRATRTIRAKRARATSELPHWEELRCAGRAIKDRTLRHLDSYLVQFEENLTAHGGRLHWATDADEANRIVLGIVKSQSADEVVKIKSMVTQEVGLNEALESEGIAAWETDLAELIVQLGHDRPSNILVPAIHRNRDEVREIFIREMGRYGRPAPDGLSNDPACLAAAARAHLREKFLRARVAVCGANFCVAETGTVVIVESEGNGRMCLTLPEVLVAVTGIEKLVPTLADLEVMLQLLPRSSTGERMNPYTSMFTGVTPGDGPQELHVVLVDNGRTRALADATGREVLRCIRCAACMHACPVYALVGGHAYGSVYPGPLGSVLTPLLRGLDSQIDKSLPYASTLCGACAEVCPVKIPLPDLLVHLRHKVVEEKKRGHLGLEQLLMRVFGWAMGSGRRFAALGACASAARRLLRRPRLRRLPWHGRRWTDGRDLRMPAARTFRSVWNKGTRTHGHMPPANDRPDATGGQHDQ